MLPELATPDLRKWQHVFRITFVFVVLIHDGYSHPDTKHDECYQDSQLCDDSQLPKLDVSFGDRDVTCNQLVTRDDAIQAPVVQYKNAKKNQQYLLIMIDPDAPFPCAPSDVTMEHILHYVTIVQEVNGVLLPERIFLNYHPPAPPRGIHRYQFFLFLWTHDHKLDLDYIKPDNRAGFNLTNFEILNQLKEPVAVFQFQSQHHVEVYLYCFIILGHFVLSEAIVGFIGNVAFLM